MAKLGDGTRSKKLQAKLRAKGAQNPAALAAWIGREKYGKARFAELSAMGRAAGMKKRRASRRIRL